MAATRSAPGRRRKASGAIAVTLVLLAWLQAGPASADRRTFAPDRDSYVSAARAADNFGAVRTLRVDADPVARAYLRFDVTLPARAIVTDAVLRLSMTSVSSSAGFEVRRVPDTSWDETSITYGDAPAIGARLAESHGWSTTGYVSVPLPGDAIEGGPISLAIATGSPTAKAFASGETADPPQLDVTYSAPPAACADAVDNDGDGKIDLLDPGCADAGDDDETDPPAGASKVVLAAGDIQPSGTTSSPTAPLLDAYAPDAVLTLGDNQYPTGSLADYNAFYSATWGRPSIKPRTYPSPGNHELVSGLASNYCAYFRDAAVDPCPGGRAYYSFDLGAWHVVALDSSRVSIDTAQRVWLRNDLAAHPSACTLAYWHHPRYSGGPHGSHRLNNVWTDLMAAGVDVVLAGHDHNYQRFARMDDDGHVEPINGIRSFVVGTGGKSHYANTVIAGQEAADVATFGVLLLRLDAGSYGWRFIPEAAGTFTDVGWEPCH